VEGDAAVPRPERPPLHDPGPAVGPQAVDEQQRLAVGGTPDLVVEAGPVGGPHVGHRRTLAAAPPPPGPAATSYRKRRPEPSRRAWTPARAASTSSATARGPLPGGW